MPVSLLWIRQAIVAIGFIAVAGSTAAQDLLAPEKAFGASVRPSQGAAVVVRFNVADGYYLYRDKLRFRVDGDAAVVDRWEAPKGKVKEDEFFGRQEIFRGPVDVRVVLNGAPPGRKVTLLADAQGCADLGVCYPPFRQRLAVSIPPPRPGGAVKKSAEGLPDRALAAARPGT